MHTFVLGYRVSLWGFVFRQTVGRSVTPRPEKLPVLNIGPYLVKPMVLDMAVVHVKEGPSNYVLHQAERYGNEAVNNNVARLRHACNRFYSGNNLFWN